MLYSCTQMVTVGVKGLKYIIFLVNNQLNKLLVLPAINKKAWLTPGKRATAVCIWILNTTYLLLPSHCCFTPPSWGTPCDINAIYTSLKSTFSGLQFRCSQYGSIFIHLAAIASETREMSRNSKWIWPYSSSRSSKVIGLGVNGKPICNFLLVINCNFSRICMLPFSRYSRLKIENCWFYPPLPCLTLPLGGTLKISGWNLPLKN